MGTQWDKPVFLDAAINEDYTGFILEGNFKECCDKHRKLNDETMRYVNKDVCNRIFTLLCRNLIA